MSSTTTRRRVSFDTNHHAMPQPPMLAGSIVLTEEESEWVDDMSSSIYVLPSIWWAYFVLGAAMLLGFNVMINSIPYFLKRVEGSSYESTLGFYLTTSLTLTNFAALLYSTLTSTRVRIAQRIVASITVIAILNLLLQLSTFAKTSAGVLFTFVLLVAIALGVASAILQTAAMALASLFGSDAVQAVISGQAAIGVAVSIARLFSTVASLDSFPQSGESETDDWSSAMFFGLSTLFSVGGLAAFWLVTRTKDYKQIMSSPVHPASAENDEDEIRALVEDRPTSPDSLSFYEEAREGPMNPIKMLALNKYLNFSVTFVFFITLAVFPPITTSILSVHDDTSTFWSLPLVFQAIHFVVFNMADLAGRLIPSHPSLLISSPVTLVALSLLRVAFIPLFLLCNIVTQDRTGQPVINSDAIFFLLVFLLGLTNGYTSCSAIVCASSLKLNPLLEGKNANIDIAAVVASFSLALGLVLGSIASFAVKAIVCGGCNPFIE